MSAPIRTFLRAYYDANHKEMRSIIEAIDPSDIHYKYFRSLYLDFDSKASTRENEDLVRFSLDNPPSDIKLFLLIIRSFTILAIQSNRDHRTLTKFFPGSCLMRPLISRRDNVDIALLADNRLDSTSISTGIGSLSNNDSKFFSSALKS